MDPAQISSGVYTLPTAKSCETVLLPRSKANLEPGYKELHFCGSLQSDHRECSISVRATPIHLWGISNLQ